MPGFLITIFFGSGLFFLHALAHAPSARAFAFCELTVALLLGGALVMPALRREAINLALRLGALTFATIALGYLLDTRSEAQWHGLWAACIEALGPCLAAIAGYALASAWNRHGLLRGLYLAGALCAIWSSLSFLAMTRGAGPSAAALLLDFALNPYASMIFALSFTGAAFALGEEVVRKPRRDGPRLAPLAQRLVLPLAACLCCLIALHLSKAVLPVFAAGLGASAIAIGLGLRARRAAGPLWAAMPAAMAFGLTALSLAAGEPAPWALPPRDLLAEPAWIPALALVLITCSLAKDHKRRPGRGLALMLGCCAVMTSLAAFSHALNSPSGLTASALLIGLALSYRDAEAKPARRQKALGVSAGAKAR